MNVCIDLEVNIYQISKYSQYQILAICSWDQISNVHGNRFLLKFFFIYFQAIQARAKGSLDPIGGLWPPTEGLLGPLRDLQTLLVALHAVNYKARIGQIAAVPSILIKIT